MSVPTIALALAVAATAAGAQAEPGEPFRIFFNWAKPELTSDAKATLAEVVNAYRQQQPARLLIIGHTDRSGPAVANLRTSKQRAEAVRDYLAGQGLPAAVLATAGRGEAQAIVPTKDGVREAQNRRVEIHFEGTGGTTARNSARAPLSEATGMRRGRQRSPSMPAARAWRSRRRAFLRASTRSICTRRAAATLPISAAPVHTGIRRRASMAAPIPKARTLATCPT